MNVRKLREIINGLPDDAQLVVPSSDHSYRFAKAIPSTALYDSELRLLTEDHGEDQTPEADYGKRIQVLVIE